ncbi:MAG TPA: hypothetical protein PKV66_00085 [Candidatus Pelethenecus sp.]|nr:hypothetical protein [Candidatus Pelethenecus sp.]
MNEHKVNSHILKISGSVEIPQALTSGFNYKVTIDGAVPKIEMVDNENGSFDVIYKMKPIRVELVNELGETLKAKDPRSNATKARAQAIAIYNDKRPNTDEETFYNAISAVQRGMANDIAEQVIKQNNW